LNRLREALSEDVGVTPYNLKTPYNSIPKTVLNSGYVRRVRRVRPFVVLGNDWEV
jgi:hypothetical protein